MLTNSLRRATRRSCSTVSAIGDAELLDTSDFGMEVYSLSGNLCGVTFQASRVPLFGRGKT